VLRQAIELGQGSDEREMHEGMISVCLVELFAQWPVQSGRLPLALSER
jgi:hypothetical protein